MAEDAEWSSEGSQVAIEGAVSILDEYLRGLAVAKSHGAKQVKIDDIVDSLLDCRNRLMFHGEATR